MPNPIRRGTQKDYIDEASVLFLRNIPRRRKDAFKSVCSRRGESMTDVVLALMQAYIKNPADFHVVRHAGAKIIASERHADGTRKSPNSGE